MKRTLLIVLLAVLLALLFRKYCFEVIYIASGSMEPALMTDEQVIVNKLSYLFKGPSRGDIVMLESPYDGKGIVKRIIALPGETIKIDKKKIFINGSELTEEYVYIIDPATMYVGDNIEDYELMPDQYFIMGDNRDKSRDSRDWSEEEGLQTDSIARRRIQGKIIKIH